MKDILFTKIFIYINRKGYKALKDWSSVSASASYHFAANSLICNLPLWPCLTRDVHSFYIMVIKPESCGFFLIQIYSVLQ